MTSSDYYRIRLMQGQFVAEHGPSGQPVGVHFTLRLRLIDYHVDDSWDVLTARDTFADHDPVHGMTLYRADVFVQPDHQHHGLAHALTDATRQRHEHGAVARGLRATAAKSGRRSATRTARHLGTWFMGVEALDGRRVPVPTFCPPAHHPREPRFASRSMKK
jgi:GNAT superfamily N-acetyltransferase